MATISPKQALDLAKQNKAQFVDLKFIDFLGIWQHFTMPIDELSEAVFEEGLGFDGSSIRGWQADPRLRHAGHARRQHGGDGPLHVAADAVAHLQHRRPDHQGAVLARPAQHRR